MTGRGHLISGSMILVDTYGVSACVMRSSSSIVQSDIFKSVDSEFNLFTKYDIIYDFTVVNLMLILLSFILFYLGLVLPDIDLEDSTISHMLHFHIPIRHRGFTHSMYFVILFMGLGLFVFQPLFYLGFGLLSHDVMDAFSSSGWVPFYPIGRYKIMYGNVMRKHWYLKFYKTGETSETVFLFIFGGISLAGLLFLAYLFIM